MTEHTKEPWAHRNGRIYQADRDVLTIANIARASDGDYSEANARRIVACVNACSGINTEQLERHYNAGGGIDSAMEEAALREQIAVFQQRDQLLEALEACLSDDFDTPKPNCKTWHIREQAKAAIAAVKGEK